VRGGGLSHAAEAAAGALADALRSGLEPTPLHAVAPSEADAELLDLGGDGLVAVHVATLHASSDFVACRDAYERGWVAATAALSGLAAVAAEPKAVVLACAFAPETASPRAARELARGAAAAAEAQGAHVAGATTSRAPEESVTATALGLVERGAAMTRVGARPGDRLWATGPAGRGNVAGVRNLLGEEPEEAWRPTARCAVAPVLAGRARACTATRAGLLAAAVLLARANATGVEVEDSDALYDPRGAELAARLHLPRWLLAAGEWGEYELLFAVAPEDEAGCVEALAAAGVEAVPVGRLLAAPELSLRTPDERLPALSLLERLREAPPLAARLAGVGSAP
jgi:thiamine-monophosphate kinase